MQMKDQIMKRHYVFLPLLFCAMSLPITGALANSAPPSKLLSPVTSEGFQGYDGYEGDIKMPDLMPDPSCDFNELLGLSVDSIDQTALFQDRPVRVLTPYSIVTQDYSPSRVNVTYDEETRLIIDVSCG